MDLGYRENVPMKDRIIAALTRERDAYAKTVQAANEAFMQKVKEFSIIKRHSALILWNFDKRHLCTGILDIIVDETDTENCSLWLRDPDLASITLVAACGQEDRKPVYIPEHDPRSRTLKLGEGAAGWVAQHGESLLIGDVRQSPYFIHLEAARDIKSLLCLPIKGEDGVLGVLNLSHPFIDAFSKENELVLQLITAQAGLAFSNYMLFKEAREFNKKLEQIVTERTRNLRESQERFNLAVGSGKVGVWDWDLLTGALFLSENLKAMLGYDDQDLLRMEDWRLLIHPDDQEMVATRIKDHLDGKTQTFDLEYRRLHRKGHVFWFCARGRAFRDVEGKPVRMTGADTDITDLKKAEARLLYEANHDKLTGLANRSLFIDWVTDALERNAKNGPFALLCLDLDRFKIINDSLGHQKGDRLIEEVSRRMERLLQQTGLKRYRPQLARLGGDEFGLLLEGVDTEEKAIGVAEKLQAAINQPFTLEEQEIITTVTIGVVLSCWGYQHPEDMLRDADAALNQAKAQGKACYEVFKKTFYHQALYRFNLEYDLRKALADGPEQFHLHYQPIINLPTGKISGFEALLRWAHPRGQILPGEFIPIAEETGLIIPLGERVLMEACRQMAIWRETMPLDLYLSVNLSTRQFIQGGLVGQVARAIEETGLDPCALRLELTESVIMENLDLARESLMKLREMDLKLLLDDFGTGYSSLSYLHRFPLDTLKIDSSFVGNMHKAQQNLAIVKTVKMLACSLKMDVVAEGIETEEQLHQLRELKCEYGQGYFFSRPLACGDAEALIQSDPKW